MEAEAFGSVELTAGGLVALGVLNYSGLVYFIAR